MTVYGNCDTCVLAVPSMDLRVQAAVSQAVETAGFSVIRVLDFALAGALRFAKDWSKEGYFLQHHVGCRSMSQPHLSNMAVES